MKLNSFQSLAAINLFSYFIYGPLSLTARIITTEELTSRDQLKEALLVSSIKCISFCAVRNPIQKLNKSLKQNINSYWFTARTFLSFDFYLE